MAMKFRSFAAAALCWLALPGMAQAQKADAPGRQTDYPSKPIRLLYGYPPGGTGDLLARMIGKRVTETESGNTGAPQHAE